MIKGRTLAVAATLLVFLDVQSAHAGDNNDVAPDQSAFVVSTESVTGPNFASSSPPESAPVTEAHGDPPLCNDVWGQDIADCVPTQECIPSNLSATGYVIQYTYASMQYISGGCDPDAPVAAEPAQPQVTEPLVRRALRRIALPASEVVVQPPGGRTLVNFDTLFRTEPRRLVRTVRLLGRQVDLEIWPVAYRWRHGDGTEQVSERPGRVYEEGVPRSAYVSHRYSDAGVTVRPRVDTTYAARFRVDGGAWQEVLGTVTIPGLGSALRVVEGRPALVAAD